MSLIAHYKLDETAGATTVADSSGNGRTGTPAGTVTLGVTGRFGTAAAFDGTSGRIEVAHDATLAFARTQPFSVSAWVYTTVGAGSNLRIVCKLEASGNFPGWELLRFNNSQIYLQILATDGTALVVRTDATLLVNTWTHVCATYDGSATAAGCKLYVDGAAAAQATVASSLTTGTITNTAPMQIGSLQTLGGTYWTGSLDDVRLYDHALTAGEVATVFAGSSPMLLLRRRRAS